MKRLALFALTLAACNQWVRPTPPPPLKRSPEEQRQASVSIESYCDPFDDGALAKGKIGSGVMVSNWQVLTAIHVVDCQSTIPYIRVTNYRGQSWKFAPEKEWVNTWLQGERDGIARIQMATGDTLRPDLRPPAVHEDRILLWEPLYIQTSNPTRQEKVVEGSGWEYGGASYGGTVFTYVGETEHGFSGSGVYEIGGELAGIHLGRLGDAGGFSMTVTDEMVP